MFVPFSAVSGVLIGGTSGFGGSGNPCSSDSMS